MKETISIVSNYSFTKLGRYTFSMMKDIFPVYSYFYNEMQVILYKCSNSNKYILLTTENPDKPIELKYRITETFIGCQCYHYENIILLILKNDVYICDILSKQILLSEITHGLPLLVPYDNLCFVVDENKNSSKIMVYDLSLCEKIYENTIPGRILKISKSENLFFITFTHKKSTFLYVFEYKNNSLREIKNEQIANEEMGDCVVFKSNNKLVCISGSIKFLEYDTLEYIDEISLDNEMLSMSNIALIENFILLQTFDNQWKSFKYDLIDIKQCEIVDMKKTSNIKFFKANKNGIYYENLEGPITSSNMINNQILTDDPFKRVSIEKNKIIKHECDKEEWIYSSNSPRIYDNSFTITSCGVASKFNREMYVIIDFEKNKTYVTPIEHEEMYRSDCSFYQKNTNEIIFSTAYRNIVETYSLEKL